MAAPALKLVRTGTGDRIKPTDGDIIECTIRGAIKEIDAILEDDPEQINAQHERSGITPIIAASGLRNEAMVKHLLSKTGVDIRLRDDFGKDALDHARPFPEIVALLMEHLTPGGMRSEPRLTPI